MEPSEDSTTQFCRNCRKPESEMRVSIRDCQKCWSTFYCSQGCRETDVTGLSCHGLISETTTISADCYMVRSLNREPESLVERLDTLTCEEMGGLLSGSRQDALAQSRRAEMILSSIESWNADLTKRFKVKDTPFQFAPLRMLLAMSPTSQPPPRRKITSFIALSYAWKSFDQNSPNSCHISQSLGKAMPVSRSLWKFLLDMRKSDQEGVWIDQVCINQISDLEKRSAIDSMDTLYANARLLFIALDDIRLTLAEVEHLSDAFQGLSTQHEVVFKREILHVLFDIISKIFSARWFSRAWCFHEWHMSKNRIIAIPCEAGPGQAQDSVIGLVNFDHFIYRLPYFAKEEVRKQNSKIVRGISRFLHTPSSAYSNIIANTFSYNAKYLIDKLSIAINLCRLPIAVKECALTNDDACLDVLILALAAGDGTVLTTRGEQLQLSYKAGQVSWCRRPDEGGWNGRYEIPQSHGISRLSGQRIVLDLFFLNGSKVCVPSGRNLEVANVFLRSSCAKQLQSVYLLDDVECHEVAQTIACTLDCGHRWMTKAWPRIAGEVGDEIGLKWERIKHLSQDIFEILFPDTVDLVSDEEYQACAEVLLRFIACVLCFGKFWEFGTSIPVNSSGDFAISDLHLKGHAYRVPSPTEAKLWSGTHYSYYPRENVSLAVPRALAQLDFPLSDRLLLLERVDAVGVSCWKVRDKTCLLGCPPLYDNVGYVALRRDQQIVG